MFVSFLLKMYHIFLSPLIHLFVGPSFGCRYIPSCSVYARDVLSSKSGIRAYLMITWRVLRCHPWSDGGWDPVSHVEGNPKPCYKRVYPHLR